jgi:hypothetical protein
LVAAAGAKKEDGKVIRSKKKISIWLFS